MAVQSSPRLDHDSEGARETTAREHPVPISPNAPSSVTGTPRLPYPYVNTDLDSRLTNRERHQLPSPSLTPSPRSPSPLGVFSDTSSPVLDEYAPSLSNGSIYSGSFDVRPAPSLLVGEKDDATLASPLPISKSLPPLELHDIPEEKPRKIGRQPVGNMSGDDKTLKLSPTEMQKLTSDPDSLPVTTSRRSSGSGQKGLEPSPFLGNGRPVSSHSYSDFQDYEVLRRPSFTGFGNTLRPRRDSIRERRLSNEGVSSNTSVRRPNAMYRAISNPPPSTDQVNPISSYISGQSSPKRKAANGPRPDPLDLNASSLKIPVAGNRSSSAPDPPPSPIPQSMPLPPMSMPTYLQLELAESRPSPLYIYRSPTCDRLYESSEVKFERLLNFLLLPPQLEQVLYFGTLTCLDAWLYTFTILPLRFLKALGILIKWWVEVIVREVRFISGFIYHGAGRMWLRQRGRSLNNERGPESRSVSRTGRSASRQPVNQAYSGRQPESTKGALLTPELPRPEGERRSRRGWGRRHRRTKSYPSSLSSGHKADLLQGAVIIASCIILLKLDASRMYHSIRGQAAIKLYVIYNLLEVCDRLFAALGQDIFECLFSNETVGRDTDGRSKILRPLGMFVLSLIYNVIHATALFYQVITLNVAVNSYSNALLTLLMSNQFVEIKSTVFKKFEKDNLFQLTCADVVERFQLWLMLLIIAMRNIVEVGGLSLVDSSKDAFTAAGNSTVVSGSRSIIPNSFTILPSWSGEVLTPFLFVLGSEMLVDWIKHAYISKFNNVKPALYQRYLDVLAKDYYTHAFVDQNLIKRLGLPVIPLSCLFIRASVQTYHMFLATHFQPPLPATTTSISVDAAVASPATTAALEHFDYIIRHALGRATYGIPNPAASHPWYLPSADDVIAALTMLIFFLVVFFLLLACKLLLGMLLLKYARNRYRGMKKREQQSYDTKGKRLGGWGMVEVDDDKRRWIYDDDPETLKKLKGKEKAAKEKADKEDKAPDNLEKISRYEMAAKRIW
ncbi:eukaryotic membrane protein family-domain-containing protein [Xylogone sp. PMI_703]|nr:eukaryotic membrane protein family-domain-containing protein [Xylogone sp. PMI_703]